MTLFRSHVFRFEYYCLVCTLATYQSGYSPLVASNDRGNIFPEMVEAYDYKLASCIPVKILAELVLIIRNWKTQTH
jgi:hypothetical protein